MRGPTPRVDPLAVDSDEQIRHLLGLRFPKMTEEFKQMISGLYFNFFTLERDVAHCLIFAGFGPPANGLATMAIAYLAGYDENNPPFIIKDEVGWVSLQWREYAAPSQ